VNFAVNGHRKILSIFQNPVPADAFRTPAFQRTKARSRKRDLSEKMSITSCSFFGRLYVRQNPADPVTFSCEQAGITLKRDS